MRELSDPVPENWKWRAGRAFTLMIFGLEIEHMDYDLVKAKNRALYEGVRRAALRQN